MPRSRTRSCEARSGSRSHVYSANRRIVCNCGWELRLGYGVAVSLAIFEAKRFFLLALELFVEWQVIRFAGGYRPVVLTFVDITLGFPCALAAVYTIRKRQTEKLYTKSRKIFAYLLLTISACAVLNVATMASIGYNVSVRQRAIAGVFNASMHLYVTTTSHKYAVDQMQFVLQCCGHSSYADWFLFDWQLVDYASREDMSRQSRISDEIYRDRGVPFSCCNIRVLRPCVNSQMNENDAETVNEEGCAGILSKVLVRVVFVAYTMTTMLVLTQAILVFFLAKIAKRSRLDELTSGYSSSQFANGSSQPLVEFASPVSSEEYSVTEKDYTPRPRTRRGYRRDSGYSVNAWRSSAGSGEKGRRGGGGAVFSGFSDCLQESPSSGATSGSGARNGGGAARIKPSVHVEHRVPKKKPTVKRIR